MNEYLTIFPQRLTKIINLPVGTSFFVHNGGWNGVIIDKEGTKFIKCLYEDIEVTDDYELEITIEIIVSPEIQSYLDYYKYSIKAIADSIKNGCERDIYLEMNKYIRGKKRQTPTEYIDMVSMIDIFLETVNLKYNN